MCLITRVPELHILFTSANVKIILEGVDCTCNVRTLLVDMDPTLHSLDNSIPLLSRLLISSKNRACILASDSRNHMVTIFVHPLLPCRSAPLQADSPHAPSSAAGGLLVLQRRSHLLRALHVEVVDFMSSAFVSLWVCRFLVCFRHSSSSSTLFLCASLGPWCSHDIIRESSVHHCLLAERCQSTHSS